ncbi:hypothetical protein GCM10008985_03450 [Halococcus dombrowskii]|uniref:Uncharacterized protein n=1 Tax=Halococcus dombrowskii TaxID=179637 RepID=A0AAV3SCN5_HALDO
MAVVVAVWSDRVRANAVSAVHRERRRREREFLVQVFARVVADRREATRRVKKWFMFGRIPRSRIR